MFDEVYGFLPPHPHNPPTKRPLVALMKQARAFGVGVVVAAQNPMDLDYRTLSNAGLWCIGRLQTDADRARVVDGLSGMGDAGELAGTIKRLAARWFVVRNVHAQEGSVLPQPRWAMSFMRGPMTRNEIRMARELATKITGKRTQAGRTRALTARARRTSEPPDIPRNLKAKTGPFRSRARERSVVRHRVREACSWTVIRPAPRGLPWAR